MDSSRSYNSGHRPSESSDSRNRTRYPLDRSCRLPPAIDRCFDETDAKTGAVRPNPNQHRLSIQILLPQSRPSAPRDLEKGLRWGELSVEASDRLGCAERESL